MKHELVYHQSNKKSNKKNLAITKTEKTVYSQIKNMQNNSNMQNSSPIQAGQQNRSSAQVNNSMNTQRTSLLRVRRTSNMIENHSEQDQEENNFRSPYYFRDTVNEGEGNDDGESPAGAHESERYVSYLPERLYHENAQLQQPSHYRGGGDPSSSGSAQRNLERHNGSVQINRASEGRVVEEEDRLTVHDRRMLEELFREALMIDDHDQERSVDANGRIGEHLQYTNPIMIRDYATSERAPRNQVVGAMNSPRRQLIRDQAIMELMRGRDSGREEDIENFQLRSSANVNNDPALLRQYTNEIIDEILDERPPTRASQRVRDNRSPNLVENRQEEEDDGARLTEDEIIYLTRRRAALMNPDEYREAANQIIANHYERLQMENESESEAQGSPRRRYYEQQQQVMERNVGSAGVMSSTESGINPFTEVIPSFWRQEILEPTDSPLRQPILYAIMQGFGSLASFLYCRLMRISRESKDDRAQVKDLRLVYSVTLQTIKGLSKRRQSAAQSGEDEDSIQDDRKYIELKYMLIILDYFNYHVSLAKREHQSRVQVRWLVKNLLPSIEELQKSLEDYYVHEDDLIVYKLLIDILERYCLEWESLSTLKSFYKKQLLPFAIYFYKYYIPAMCSVAPTPATDPFKSLNHATIYFKKHYPKLVQMTSCKEYVEYYEQRDLEVDRILGTGRLRKDCIMFVVNRRRFPTIKFIDDKKTVKASINGTRPDQSQPPTIISQNILVQPNTNHHFMNIALGQQFSLNPPYPYQSKVTIQRGSGTNMGNVSPHLVAKGEPYMNKMPNSKPAKFLTLNKNSANNGSSPMVGKSSKEMISTMIIGDPNSTHHRISDNILLNKQAQPAEKLSMKGAPYRQSVMPKYLPRRLSNSMLRTTQDGFQAHNIPFPIVPHHQTRQSQEFATSGQQLITPTVDLETVVAPSNHQQVDLNPKIFIAANKRAAYANDSVVEEDDDNSYLAISADVTADQHDITNQMNELRNQELNDVSQDNYNMAGGNESAPRRNSALKRKQSASLRKYNQQKTMQQQPPSTLGNMILKVLNSPSKKSQVAPRINSQIHQQMLIYGGVPLSNYTTGARNSSAKLTQNDSARRPNNNNSRSAKRGAAITQVSAVYGAEKLQMSNTQFCNKNSRTLESAHMKTQEKISSNKSQGDTNQQAAQNGIMQANQSSVQIDGSTTFDETAPATASNHQPSSYIQPVDFKQFLHTQTNLQVFSNTPYNLVKAPQSTKMQNGVPFANSKSPFMTTTQQQQQHNIVKQSSNKKAMALAQPQPYTQNNPLISATKRAKTPSQNGARIGGQKRHSSTEMNCYIPQQPKKVVIAEQPSSKHNLMQIVQNQSLEREEESSVATEPVTIMNSFVVQPSVNQRQELSKSVNLQNGGLPKIKEVEKAPLLDSVAMSKNNGNNEKKFIQFLQSIERNKTLQPTQQPLQLKDFSMGIQIGAGAFATVKRAIHKESSFTVAIKTYDKKHLVKDPNAQEALHKEILILSQIDHPNVMALFEVIDTRMNVNLVMEMCNGKSLYHYIKKKESQRLPEELCRVIFRQLVDGMAYLHHHNIVHRDLKLDNILIDPSEKNRIKIIDFGFSIKATADQKLTLFCGTPHYMDPDISRKKDYNGHAADVWALGVILFILLTGKLPFFGEYEQDLYRKIQTGKFQFPQPQNPADKTMLNMGGIGGISTQTQRYHEPPVISQQCKNMIKKIFQVDSDKRITAKELLEDEWVRGGDDQLVGGESTDTQNNY